MSFKTVILESLVTIDYSLFIARKPFLRGFMEAICLILGKIFFLLFQGKVKYFLKKTKSDPKPCVLTHRPPSASTTSKKDSLIFVFLTQEI